MPVSSAPCSVLLETSLRRCTNGGLSRRAVATVVRGCGSEFSASARSEAPGASGLGSAPTNAAWRTETRFEMANGRTVRQGGSDVDALGDTQGIFQFDPKIAHGAIDLRVAE